MEATMPRRYYPSPLNGTPVPEEWAFMKKITLTCYFCPSSSNEGLFCAGCRTKLDELADKAVRRYLNVYSAIVTTRTGGRPDDLFDLLCEPARQLAFSQNLQLLELALLIQAPRAIVDKVQRNLASIGNPREYEEALLLLPNQEFQMVSAWAGIQKENAELPVNRHFAAIQSRGEDRNMSSEVALGMAELVKLWGLGSESDYFRNRTWRALSLTDRNALRRISGEGAAERGSPSSSWTARWHWPKACR